MGRTYFNLIKAANYLASQYMGTAGLINLPRWYHIWHSRPPSWPLANHMKRWHAVGTLLVWGEESV